MTLTNGFSRRGDNSWIARANSPLPVPLSPVISTVESVSFTASTRSKIRRIRSVFPTMSRNGNLVFRSSAIRSISSKLRNNDEAVHLARLARKERPARGDGNDASVRADEGPLDVDRGFPPSPRSPIGQSCWAGPNEARSTSRQSFPSASAPEIPARRSAARLNPAIRWSRPTVITASARLFRIAESFRSPESSPPPAHYATVRRFPWHRVYRKNLDSQRAGG